MVKVNAKILKKSKRKYTEWIILSLNLIWVTNLNISIKRFYFSYDIKQFFSTPLYKNMM